MDKDKDIDTRLKEIEQVLIDKYGMDLDKMQYFVEKMHDLLEKENITIGQSCVVFGHIMNTYALSYDVDPKMLLAHIALFMGQFLAEIKVEQNIVSKDILDKKIFN